MPPAELANVQERGSAAQRWLVAAFTAASLTLQCRWRTHIFHQIRKGYRYRSIRWVSESF